MRALIQRVSSAYVEYRDPNRLSSEGVNPLLLHATPSDKLFFNASHGGPPPPAIEKGLVILAGFEREDTLVCIEQMLQKIKNLRLFSDGMSEGKLDLPCAEVAGQCLLVSQVTLYADCKYGNRPSFERAAQKSKAKEYYEHFVLTATRIMGSDFVKHTPFGSELLLHLTNDGPVTIWLDSHMVL